MIEDPRGADETVLRPLEPVSPVTVVDENGDGDSIAGNSENVEESEETVCV